MKIQEEKLRYPRCYKKIYAILIFLTIITMGIGYARVDSVNMLINGDISSNIIKDVFITNATIQNNPNNNYINTYAQTTINTDIELSNSDLNSMVTLEITILNNANKEKIFNEIIYSSSLYSNNNISFLLTGIKNGDTIKSGESITTYLTFKYSDSYKNSKPSKPYNNHLSSVLQYNFVDELLETYNVTITGVSFTPTSNELKAIKDKDYSINLQSEDYYLFVTMGNTNLTLNNGYTFSNGILTIKNVSNDIDITAIPKGTIDFVLTETQNTQTKSFSISGIKNLGNSQIEFLSNQIIKSIKLSVPYTGGNKNYTVQCILSVDGKQISTQDLVFKTRGNETLTLNFTNVNIPIKSKITFTFDSSKNSSQGNQAVIIKSMEVDATF